ncbi:MAG: HAD family hydrolase, partial [Betaproteobacteria bacterium]|nr:HAD family hydrolase [Betaproteobacteria bacterium]
VFTSLDTAACLGIAAALETSSTHPLGRAIVHAARASGSAQFVAVSLTNVPGEGVEGQVNGRHYRLGRERFALTETGRAAQPASDPQPASDLQPASDPQPASAAQTRSADQADASDPSAPAHSSTSRDHQGLHSEVWLSQDGLPLARIALADPLREEAPAVVAALRKAGLTVHLVSGDRRAVVNAVGDRLDIGSCHPEATPADKLAFVQALQCQGRRVLAVGDGINDAPLLAAADVSIAMGCASTLARTSASVVLLGSGLDDVTALRTLALRTRRVIVQNLGWALAYNIIAIPAAAFGWIAPWAAALGMSASSLLVAGNALRLLESRRHHTAPSTGAR